MSIEVQNISKIYGQQKALNNVSFDIPQGDVIGLLGPNGAGKSTMMKILTGFIPPTSGTAVVNGFDVANNSLEIRQIIGYLPEHNPLYLDMYVKEYLQFVAGLYKVSGKKEQKVAGIIERTGLTIEQNKKIGALSKGYRQRVGLAQALIHDPEVLILDEPTTGLDPNQIIEIRNLISEIGREKTVMLSTHIMQEVEAICNRVIIVNRGEIVANEKAENLHLLLTDYAQTVQVEFTAQVDPAKLKKLQDVAEVVHTGGNNYLLRSHSKNDIRPTVFNFAVETGIALLTLKKEEQSVENVFRQLTQNALK